MEVHITESEGMMTARLVGRLDTPAAAEVTREIQPLLDHAQAMSLNLALEEAVSNVMLYAYPAGSEGRVDIETVIRDDRIDFRVIDSGVPFDPTAASDPDLAVDLKDRPIGGLGIYLVKRIMDEVSYTRQDGKNILSMTKKR